MGRIGGCQEWDNCYNLKLIYLVALTFDLATVGSFLTNKLTALQTVYSTLPLFHQTCLMTSLFHTSLWSYSISLAFTIGLWKKYIWSIKERKTKRCLKVWWCCSVQLHHLSVQQKISPLNFYQFLPKEFCLFDHSTESKKGQFGGKSMHRKRPEHRILRLNVLMFGRVWLFYVCKVTPLNVFWLWALVG